MDPRLVPLDIHCSSGQIRILTLPLTRAFRLYYLLTKRIST
jgi:hypothetical protein